MPEHKISKNVINVVFVGGGRGCYEILNLLKSYSPTHFLPNIVAVADTNVDAVGRRHAERLGIPTSSDYRQFLRDENIDLIIELTGIDEVLSDIHKNRLEKIKVIDHVGALFLWDIIAILDEKIHLEKKVSDLDTMAAIGEIAYRLTHELRNPLMITGGLVRRMMTRMDLPHKIRIRLKHMAAHIQHMEEVLSDICDVVRPLQPHYTLTGMSEFLENWCNAARAEARLVGVVLNAKVDPDLPAIYIDPSLIRQALWHIVENSMDAMAETGGTINIKALLCWDTLLIEINDTGTGFRDISITTAMQPFISTKQGRMGLGLSLCRQIILDHGGDIEIINKKDGGATIIVEIPITFKVPKK